MRQRIELTELECLRCGHKWYPRKPEKPRICPACGSAYWDVPRQTKEAADSDPA